MISKSNVKSFSCDDVRIFRYLFQNNVLKTLLDFFVIAGIIKVSVSVIRPRPSARLITLITRRRFSRLLRISQKMHPIIVYYSSEFNLLSQRLSNLVKASWFYEELAGVFDLIRNGEIF